MTQYKTFKQLINELSNISSKEDLNQLCFDIDQSFQHEKISWNDNETLYRIINKVIKREFID